MICQSVRCFNGLTCRTKWLWGFIPISDEKLNRCKYVICARYSNWHSNVGDGVTGGSGRSCGVNVFMSVPTDLPHLSS
ncbi:hypothetical protein GE236_15275 [Escherichia coli]|nr:hypothetical protein [Escherichia coli]